jgi:hypothetical protein
MRTPINKAETGNLDHYIKYLEENKGKTNPMANYFLGQSQSSAPENTFIQAGTLINLREINNQQ